MTKADIIGQRFPVLDRGWIELVKVSGDDMTIVNAARVSYGSEETSDTVNKAFVNRLMAKRHTSPFEHVTLTFRVRAPLVVCWQWFRHRTWSYNVQSGRYADFHADDFYVPQWSGAGAPFSDMLREHYAQSFRFYEDAIAAGIDREQARLFLPGFGVYYSFYATVNAHNLMHFLELRMSPAAQSEIRAYAEAVYSIFKSVLPWTAEAFEQHRQRHEH